MSVSNGDPDTVVQQHSASTASHSENDQHTSTALPHHDSSPEQSREEGYTHSGSGNLGRLVQTQITLLGGIAKAFGLTKDKPFKSRPVPAKDKALLKQTKFSFGSISSEIVEEEAVTKKRVIARDKKLMTQTSLVEKENAEHDPATWGKSERLRATTINKTWAMNCYHLSKSEIEELDFNPVPWKGGTMHLYRAREVEYRAWQKYGGPNGFARALDVMRDKHERNHRRGVFRCPKWMTFTVQCRGESHVIEMLIYALKEKIERDGKERERPRGGGQGCVASGASRTAEV